MLLKKEYLKAEIQKGSGKMISRSFKVLERPNNDECLAILNMMKMCFQNSSQDIYIFRLIVDYGKIFVTFHEDTPICAIQTFKNWDNHSEVQIISVATHPSFQRQGLCFFTAKNMIEWLLAADGINFIGIRIPLGHTAMLRIFKEKLGFNVINEIKEYYGPNQNRLYLRKDIYKRGGII
jgi:RimJ/RimL family protein N-acetyltransferase